MTHLTVAGSRFFASGDGYPSQVRPVLVHLSHAGLASSHLTLRILRRR